MTNRNRSNLTNGVKNEILRAIRYYVLRRLSRNSHKSYFHHRFYQLISRYLDRHIR